MTDIDAVYEARVRLFEGEEKDALLAFDGLGNRRLVLFFVTLACFIVGTFWKTEHWINLTLYLLGLAGVIFSVIWALRHQRKDEVVAHVKRMRMANEQARCRLRREWAGFPVPLVAAEFENLPESHDLDVFGKGSLFQVVCASHSPQGRHTLATWLAHPDASQEVLDARQSMVRELAPQLEWRQQLSVIGEELGAIRESDPEWLVGERWLDKYPKSLLVARLLPVPLIVLILIAFAGKVMFIWPFALLLVGLGFSRWHRKRLSRSIVSILGQERAVHHYAAIFSHLSALKTVDENLKRVHAQTDEAHAAFEKIADIGGNAGVHGTIVHPLLQGLVMWDFHVVRRIEAWQAEYSGHLDGWFEALGELEALASMAGLAHDEPTWVYPKLTEDKKIVARNIGHPLIAAEKRVGNDVTLGPEGSYLLVTGSNMSGKSTLMRSVGLNSILAQAGAPVCAEFLTLPPLQLATSMRVQDSLNEGLSFFMAELKRMREIVSQAVAADGERTVLYLLDEILQGTNTVERQAIVERIIKRLLGCNAIGAITTHDLALADANELKEHAQLVHFREDFSRDADGKPQMTFDYQLRDGIATTTNALKILEVIDMPV
jgi:hypothetical protein